MNKLLILRLPLLGFFLLVAIALSAQDSREEMTPRRLGKILTKEVGKMEGEEGAWQFVYAGHPVLVITDETANRMRIFSPIVEEKDLEFVHYQKMLEANFHSALDAKYCLYEGYVVSVFTHPLRELTSEQLVDAARQVVILADTFGTTYQSTDLIFSPGQGEEEDKRVNEKPRKKS